MASKKNRNKLKNIQQTTHKEKSAKKPLAPNPHEPCSIDYDNYFFSDAVKEYYEVERKEANEIAYNQGFALDKSIITIAGASFSIAIAFIENIINFHNAILIFLFWISMLALVTAIISTACSFKFSETCAHFKRELIDKSQRMQDFSILEEKKSS